MTKLVPIAVIACMFLFTGCAAVRMRSDISTEAKDYPKELAAAKNAGFNLSMAQFVKPLPPPSQNAAPIYLELGRAVDEHPLRDKDELIDGMSRMPSREQLAEAKKALADRKDLMALVHQAVSRPKCVYQKDWTTPDPATILFPEVATMRRAARLLSTESVVMAYEGKPLDAVRNMALGFRIADHVADEPMVISYLVSVAVDAITLSRFQTILYMSHGDPKAAAAIQEAIETGWHPHSLAYAEGYEMTAHQATLQFLRDHGSYKSLIDWQNGGGGSGPPQLGGGIGLPPWGQFMDANAAFVLKEELRLATVADKPYPQASNMRSAVAEDMKDTNNLSHFMGAILLPVFLTSGNGFFDKRAQDQALPGIMEAGAAVLIWKGAHGTYPTTLSQVMPRVPIDPFDLKPILYRREGKGFVVYSVGPTGRFDGGSPTVKPDGAETVFRYPLPAYLKT